jgi:hypothetical protein
MRALKITPPCQPSEHLNFGEIKATEILVSWGGGMGGANKTYYTTKNNGGDYTLLDGSVITLNPEFIVHKKKVKLVKMVTDTTKHTNYHEDNSIKTVVTEIFKLEHGQEYIVDYNGMAKKSDAVIFRDYTETPK